MTGRPVGRVRGTGWLGCLFMAGVLLGAPSFAAAAITYIYDELGRLRAVIDPSQTDGADKNCRVGGKPGDLGFERLVTTSFGSKFSKRLNRMIDREIARFVRALERRHRRRSA